uniref:Zinc carboxypeptidase A 1 n=1 Tax=Romanomermis culicivorax TaxID=13658 RepID=A0A915HRN5_ROMCU
MTKGITGLLACWTIIVTMVSADDEKQSHKVYRIVPDSDNQVQILKSMTKYSTKRGLNFWSYPSNIGRPVDVMVDPDKNADFLKTLDQFGISNYTIKIDDVQKLIQEKQTTNKSAWSRIMYDLPFRSVNKVNFNVADFHSYAEITKYLQDLAANYPSFIKLFSMGDSVENRKLWVLQIDKPSLQGPPKKAVYIDAGIHAREWLAPTTALYFINELVSGYLRNDPQIVQYVENLVWYVAPLVNPDGYEYTRSSSNPNVRLWRKNRGKSVCKQKNWFSQSCCSGVDLNRNFGYRWGETGASDDPCEEIFKGQTAFSEPESRSIRDFVASHLSTIDAYVTLHTYSQMWIYPYGNRKRNYPPDVNALRGTALSATGALKQVYGTQYKRGTALSATGALKQVYGTQYKVGTGADLLYDASGGSDDWTKSMGVKYVYLIELRPGEMDDDGFIVGREQITPTGRETWQGVRVVADTVLEKNGFKVVKNRRLQRKVQRPNIRRSWSSITNAL